MLERKQTVSCALQSLSVLAIAALALSTQGAFAQSEAELGKNVTLQGIPSGTVAPHGLVFGSLSGTTVRRGADDVDGSAAFGFGLGSAEEGIGLQFSTQITSLTDNFGDSGYFEIKASRRIAAGATPTYASLGITGAGFGDASVRETAATLAFTQFRRIKFAPGGPQYPIMMTLGAGTHQRNNETEPAVFGGIGIGLTENFGVSAAWSGEYVNLGTSVRFNNSRNFSMSATLYDAFDQENSRRIGVSITYFLTDLF